MSTRSNIAIKRKDGTYEKIYCHSDGYLEYNGKILDLYYKNEEKINNLINLGDISLLGFRVNPDPSIIHSFDYNERQDGVTVAYGRDRNEDNVSKKTYDNEEKFLNSFKDTWCEYVYMYDEENREWLFSKIPYSNQTNLVFTKLHDELINNGLVDKVEERLDSLVRKQIDFIYDYDSYNFRDCYESYEDAYFEMYNLFLTKKGTTNFIRSNKELIDSMEESLDDNEIHELYERGIDLIEDIRKYQKETFSIYENNNDLENMI